MEDTTKEEIWKALDQVEEKLGIRLMTNPVFSARPGHEKNKILCAIAKTMFTFMGEKLEVDPEDEPLTKEGFQIKFISDEDSYNKRLSKTLNEYLIPPPGDEGYKYENRHATYKKYNKLAQLWTEARAKYQSGLGSIDKIIVRNPGGGMKAEIEFETRCDGDLESIITNWADCTTNNHICGAPSGQAYCERV